MIIKFIDCTETHHDDMQKVVSLLSKYFDSLGISNHLTKLSDLKVARCTECRCCTQKKGEKPAKCVIKDDLNNILDEIEDSTAYVILSDRNNLFSENKLHEKFSKRLVAYHYWPYGQVQSTPRKTELTKSSILINYNTTKYFMNHSFYTSKVYMEQTAHSIGAKVVDFLAMTPKKDIMEKYENRLKEMADKLIKSFEEEAS